MSEPLIDSDYRLTEGAAWVEVGDAAIRILKTDGGVSVSIYRSGQEFVAITETYVTDEELMSFEAFP